MGRQMATAAKNRELRREITRLPNLLTAGYGVKLRETATVCHGRVGSMWATGGVTMAGPWERNAHSGA